MPGAGKIVPVYRIRIETERKQEQHMDISLGLTVANQVAIMVIMISIGFFCYKKELLTEAGVKSMSAILLNVVTPCMLINAYQQDFNSELAVKFLTAAGAAVLLHLIMIAIALIVFKKQEIPMVKKANTFMSVYSNCGFMGLPLLNAALGDEGVFLGSAYLAVFNLLYWTQGAYVFSGDKRDMLSKKAVLNPGVIGVLTGLVFFFGRIKLPGIIGTTVSGIAALNTPVAMFVIGAFLAKTKVKSALRNPNVWLVTVLRLLAFPLLSLGVLFVLTKAGITDTLTAMAVLLQVAAPCATVGSLFAVKYGYDPTYASEVIAISTLVSMITIPLMAFAGGIL